jgi:hypothetical protein
VLGPRSCALVIAGLVVLIAICPGVPGSGYRVPGAMTTPSRPDPQHSLTDTCAPDPDTRSGLPVARSPTPVIPYPVPGTLYPEPLSDSNATFWTYDTMTAELQRLAQDHPGIVSLYDLTSMIDSRFGFKKTWEGRTVWGVRISASPVMNDPGRPKIVIECSHHGDEWMGFETGMKLIEVLVNGYQQKEVQNVSGINVSAPNWSTARLSWLVDSRDIWVIPMVNPDGATYDQSVAASGGIWRKNKRDNDGNGQFDPNIDGVDINRNYPYMWGANMKGVVGPGGITITQDTSFWGSSQYHGPQDNFDDDGDAAFPRAPDWYPQHRGQDWNGIDEDPVDGIDNDGDGKIDEDRDGGFSEPETCAVEALFNALDSDGDHVNGRSDVSIVVSLHSYTGCVMWPWGYADILAKDASLMEQIGTAMAEFPGYDAYQSVNMYPTSGDTSDWFYGSMGALAFVIELGKSGQGGFHPPVDMIDNISVPNVEALLYAAEVSDVASAARALNAPSLEIGVPGIIHSPVKGAPAGKETLVEARVDNATNMRPGGLRLVYSVDGGSWTSTRMTEKGQGKFLGVIPGQKSGARVDYYLAAASLFNITGLLPQYAPYEHFSYGVTGMVVPLWGWAAGGGVVAVIVAAVAWRAYRGRLGSSVGK